MSKLVGIWGRPYINLEPYVDLSALSALDDEVCYGLAQAEVSYTGGSLKWMDVVAPWVHDDGYATRPGHRELQRGRVRALRFAGRRPRPFRSRPTARVLLRRRDRSPAQHGADALSQLPLRGLLPVEGLLPPGRERALGGQELGPGQGLHGRRAELFPRTVAFIQSLPFAEIGRCVIFGLEANDHAPFHRDTEPTPDGGERPLHHTSVSVRAAPSASTCATPTRPRRSRCGPGSTGSTTWTTTASIPTRSSGIRSASTASSSLTSWRGWPAITVAEYITGP